LDPEVHTRFRAEALGVVASVRQWVEQFQALANRMAGALPIGRSIDLMEQYARPWSLAVAGIAADVAESERERLSGLARQVFDSACDPFDAALDLAARKAIGELALFFQGAPAIHMQMFLALAHSLPGFLGNAWWALLEHPAGMARLRRDPGTMPRAIEELLRFAGPARAQFRQAVATVPMDGSNIEPQQRVILMLDRANRDPGQFPDPNELRLDRHDGGNLAFGGGTHACVAGMLIQSAAAVATEALLCRFDFSGHAVLPADYFAVRYVRSLEVVLDVSSPVD
jgi:cytochrome P450